MKKSELVERLTSRTAAGYAIEKDVFGGVFEAIGEALAIAEGGRILGLGTFRAGIGRRAPRAIRSHGERVRSGGLKSRAFAAMTNRADLSFKRTGETRPCPGLRRSAWPRPARCRRTGGKAINRVRET